MKVPRIRTLAWVVAVTAACDLVSGLGAADAGTEVPSSPGGSCPAVTVGPVPANVRADFGLDPFYEKYVDAGGIPIISSARVSDGAFAVARDVVEHMLAERPDVRAALIDARVRVGIMAPDEVTTDMPEHRDLNTAFPSVDWDERARGVGATLARPLSSVGEENLLQLASDRYRGESILVHEFGHTVWDLGVLQTSGGSTMQSRLSSAYSAALAAGRFANTYADDNANEYWAEGVQSWFDTNLQADPANGIHNSVNTRSELQAYDTELAALLNDVFPDDGWRPLCTP